MPHVAFYITGHGFGHATRMAAVASALAEQVPGLRLTFITMAPEWLLRLNLSSEFRIRPRALDVGVIQFDSIRLDPAATRPLEELGDVLYQLQRYTPAAEA